MAGVANLVLPKGQAAPPIRVLIATSDAACRDRLRCALRSNGLHIAGEVSSPGVCGLVRQLRPDVILLAPGMCTHESLADAIHVSPTSRVILVVQVINRINLIEALQLQAMAIVPAASPARVWRDSVRTVMEGRHWLNASSLALLVEMARERVLPGNSNPSPAAYGLTAREQDIIKMIATGQSNKQIAYTLALSERTVKHHLTSVFAKLGLSSRLELALFARPIAPDGAYPAAGNREGVDRDCANRIQLPACERG